MKKRKKERGKIHSQQTKKRKRKKRRQDNVKLCSKLDRESVLSVRLNKKDKEKRLKLRNNKLFFQPIYIFLI